MIVELADGIADLVHDGDSVALEGFTHLIPFAAGHEIIRQGRRDLALARMTPDIIYDQLIGMGCASRLIFSWGGNPGVGSLHRFRDAVQNGWPVPLEIEEHSHAGMANRYVAGASGLPFAVLRGYAGTDLTEHVKPITCPFTGELLTAVPALRPDVAVVHAQRADRRGNVQLWGITGIQKEAVLAASRSLVTVEEIVDELEPVAGRWCCPGGRSPRWRRRRAARTRRTRWATAIATTTRTSAGTRSAGTAAGSPTGCASTSRRRRDDRLHRRRDDDGRRGPAAARRRGLLRRDRPAEHGREPGPPYPRARPGAGVRVRLSIGAKPDRLPLSIGDGELAATADAVVSVPEVFNYWLQPGRIDVGFLGAAQIDRYANINTTVIGSYDHPRVRLPGAGGAPEIAACCREVVVVLRHSARAFVERVDFVTSVGYGDGPGHRERLGLPGAGPRLVVTDLGIMEPDPDTCELTLTQLHPGVTVADVRAATGWDLAVADPVGRTEPPGPDELDVLRALNATIARKGAA